MVNFKQEATELAKQIVESWNEYKDFAYVVTIIEDYITDMDSKYRDLIND